MEAVYNFIVCCFTAQVQVSWKRLPWIQMRVQMQPSLVSRYGFYIVTSKVRYSPNISCTLAMVLGSPCSSQLVFCRMSPCDLIIVYHIHAVWTLTTEMWSVMLAMSHVSQDDDSQKYCGHKYVHSDKKHNERTVDNEQDVLLRHAFIHAHRLKM